MDLFIYNSGINGNFFVLFNGIWYIHKFHEIRFFNSYEIGRICQLYKGFAWSVILERYKEQLYISPNCSSYAIFLFTYGMVSRQKNTWNKNHQGNIYAADGNFNDSCSHIMAMDFSKARNFKLFSHQPTYNKRTNKLAH